MKVLAVMGNVRNGETLKAVQKFEERLSARGEVTFKYLFLKDMELKSCRGCFLCLEKGEEFCPCRDDERDKIVDALTEADGVIFATPNYSLQVSALMKNFLDRLCYIFHRPRFFHKAFIPIVTQGVYGGKEIANYLETVGDFWGFITCRGICLTTPPGVRLPKEEAMYSQLLDQGAKRFYGLLTGNKSPSPSLKKVIIFRSVRSFHASKTPETADCDYRYFKEKGWLDGPYFYETVIGPVKKIFADIIDWRVGKSSKKMQEQRLRIAQSIK